MTNSSLNHIKQVEERLRKDITVKSLCRIAKAFEMGLDELVEGTEFDYNK